MSFIRFCSWDLCFKCIEFVVFSYFVQGVFWTNCPLGMTDVTFINKLCSLPLFSYVSQPSVTSVTLFFSVTAASSVIDFAMMLGFTSCVDEPHFASPFVDRDLG